MAGLAVAQGKADKGLSDLQGDKGLAGKKGLEVLQSTKKTGTGEPVSRLKIIVGLGSIVVAIAVLKRL